MDGQMKLKQARVLLIGAGGLGSPAAMYLAASGIGTLGIVDFDRVDLTNLHRQVIHGTNDVGQSKLQSATETIQDINPHVLVRSHEVALSRENALEILKDYDLVVDGTDNFPTRYLVNDACVMLGKLNVYGSILKFEGQATVFCQPGGPCYRCLFPEPPPPGVVPSCAEGGVLGVLPGIIGMIQATEAVKLILGAGESLVGRLLLYDALGMRFQELRIRRDPECPICGNEPTIHELIDYDGFCGVTMKTETDLNEITVQELKSKIESKEGFVLIDVREPYEFEISRIPGSVLIPLGQLEARLAELDESKAFVIHCKSGIRSAKACAILRSAGFDHVQNLRGGIDAWLASD
jgi:sulfur-carrier protein adenylyltransferase/sulfurtransferase